LVQDSPTRSSPSSLVHFPTTERKAATVTLAGNLPPPRTTDASIVAGRMVAVKGGVTMARRRALRRLRVGILVGFLSVSSLLSTACGTLVGAGVGAGSGAAIGAGTGKGAGKGALIGAGVGAAAGAIYDITR